MGMKMVIDNEAVISRMSLQNIQEVRDAIDSTLIAAHAVMQGILHTTFEKVSHTEFFFLNSGYFPINPNGLITCRLTQAFVHADTVVVKSADTRNLLVSGDTVVADDYLLDALRGWLKINDSYTDTWVQIAYTAGFDNTHPAPDWLQEAVLAYMPHLLAQPSGSLDAAAMNAATEASKADFAVAAKIVEPYLRNSSFQFMPV